MSALLAVLPVAAHAQRTWTAGALVGRAEHRVDLGRGTASSPGATAAAGESPADRASGTIVGGTVELAAHSWLEVQAHALGGRLEAATPGLGRDVGELGVRAGVVAFPWLVFQTGAVSRRFEMSEGSQRWTALAAGAEARLDFSGGGMRGIVRATVLPAVAATGLERPDLAVATGAGLEMRHRFLTGAVMYSLERYDFPASADAGRRLEQMGMITAKLGVRF